MKNVPLYYNEDKTKVGVLISYGFGAGFGSWADDPAVAYDARVIEYFLAHKDNLDLEEAESYFKTLGYDSLYCDGLLNCELEWAPRGVGFRIKEYDGAESLVLANQDNYWTVLN